MSLSKGESGEHMVVGGREASLWARAGTRQAGREHHVDGQEEPKRAPSS